MKKHLFTVWVLLMVCLTAMAVPAKRNVYKTLNLSNGTQVRAMLVGDEHGSFWRGDDGKTYALKGSHYEPVDVRAVAAKAKALRAKRNAQLGRRLTERRKPGVQREYFGKQRGIIILVDFTDTKFQEGHDRRLYDRVANAENFHEAPFVGSIADYFKAQSGGQFELEFDVVGPVTVSRGAEDYGQTEYVHEMVIEAVELAKDQVADWRPYDWDGNGEVNQVFLVYAGQGSHDTGSPSLIWPHASSLSLFSQYGYPVEPVEVAPGLVVNTYACGSELQANFSISGIGTICHEFSHCLGYPDYYDIDYSGGQGMDDWDLMCSGNYNGDEFVPAGYTSYERWVAGWLEPIVLENENVSVSQMKPLQDGGESYIIYNKGNRNEYFMLENRQPMGWDAGLPGAGLLIVHVDYDPDVWEENQPNDDINHQRMTPVPADGVYDWLQTISGRYYSPQSIATDPFPQEGVTAFNKRFVTYEEQARKAARLFHANADGNHWIDSSVEQIVQNADGTIAFNFVAHDEGADPEWTDARLTAGKAKEVHPQGWLQTMMQRQHDGLTGHPEALSYPYNSCLWAGEISRPDESYGDNWWRYEQTAYYTEGLLKLGYELNDEAMVAKAMEGIEYTLAHPDENGVLGNSTLVGITWPMSVFFRVLQAKYEHDGDERIPAALEKHYLNFTPEDLAGGIVGGRNIMSLEGILWTYGKTGNPKLLQLAEDAWAIQDKFAVDETAITSYEPFYMHAVTFSEMLKLPMLLYAYTGNEYYLDLAMTAVRKVESESMLPDGVPSSAEFLYGDDVSVSHETCVVVDYTWTLSHFLQVTGEAEWADKMERAIYNAGMGAITKDFKSLQYFSSLNQFVATGTSNHNIYKHGSTWMAYRPTHETECCSGNVNRMLPNFVDRMWMTDCRGGAVAAIYGPSQASFSTENGLVTITCETDYPFSDILTFKVSGDEGASIPLTLRIPGWCYWARAEINGVEYPRSLYAGSFVTVSEGVKPGDVITLTLPMRAETNSVEGQGVYFERGPLLYAYAIPQQMTEDTEEYANMHGKKPENPDFKCWNITPTGDFNYAYATDGEKIKLLNVQVEKKEGMIPFDDNCAPVNLRIPVKKIAWELEGGRYTPALPEPGTLTLLSDETQYINLVPYGSTELRLTVFPDADAEPLDEPEEEDYSRPDDAPECVEVVDGSYYAYFELPRFCWDEPIYCKVRTEDGDEADMWSSQGGDACQLVGTTDNGRHIWRWTGTADTEPIPVEIIFTNHDLLTEVMPFINGGYYIYDCPLYQAGPYVPTGIGKVYDDGLLTTDNGLPTTGDGVVYDLQGRMVGNSQSLHNGLPKGIYICNGRKIVRK